MQMLGNFGRYLLQEGMLDETTLKRAYAVQGERRHLRIGEILMGWGALPFETLMRALDTFRACSRIGEILVMNGAITRAQLDAALAQQPESGSMLGKILLEMDACDRKDLVEALSVQRRDRLDPFGVN